MTSCRGVCSLGVVGPVGPATPFFCVVSGAGGGVGVACVAGSWWGDGGGGSGSGGHAEEDHGVVEGFADGGVQAEFGFEVVEHLVVVGCAGG